MTNDRVVVYTTPSPSPSPLVNELDLPDTVPPETRSFPEVNEVFAYQCLLDSAAKNLDGKDYANSTTVHAEIAVSKIIEISRHEIGIFSTSFSGSFWNDLKGKLTKFLRDDSNRRISIITATALDKNSTEMVSDLRREYPQQFSLRTLKKGALDPVKSPNFMYGDDVASRFEDNDRDAKLGLVSAIVNFGNTERVKNMRSMFLKLEEQIE